MGMNNSNNNIPGMVDRRKLRDLGDKRNFPHTKNFGGYYGTKVFCGLSIVPIVVCLFANTVDFFFPRNIGKTDNRDKPRRS